MSFFLQQLSHGPGVAEARQMQIEGVHTQADAARMAATQLQKGRIGCFRVCIRPSAAAGTGHGGHKHVQDKLRFLFHIRPVRTG